MSEILSINIALVVLIDAIGLWLAFEVFTSRKDKTSFYFFWMNVFILVWITAALTGGMISQDSGLSLVLTKINWVSICLFFISTYFISLHFPYETEKRNTFFDSFTVLSWMAMAFLTIFTDLVISSVNIGEFNDWGSGIVYGHLVNFFFLWVGAYTLIIFYNFFKKYIKSSEQNKLKTQYLLIGLSLFAIFNMTFNVFLPMIRGDTKYYQFGDYSVVFVIIFTGIAILKRKLFGIKTVFTSLFVLFISTLLFIDAFILTEGIYLQIFKGSIFAVFLVFGRFLIRSVQREIGQKEQLKVLNESLEDKVKERTKELEEAKTVLEIRVAARTKELQELNKSLEYQVEERTKKLHERVNELEKFHKLTVGREIRMTELKKKIKDLEEKIEGTRI